MGALPRLAGFGALLSLAACSLAQPANETASNAAAPAAAVTNEASPSGNAAWGAVEAEDEASHRGLDFIAFNRSGRTITALALRPDEGPLDAGVPETPWGDNVLTQRELPDGQRAAAHYEADIELCTWQLRATFADGTSRDYPTVNLCETIRVDLR